MSVWERYDRKWTELSLKELENFAEWMNKILGYDPTIIGGWAVYFYNPSGLGSRDIDVVIPTWEMKYRVIDNYLANNGYEIRQKAFGVAEWIKYLDPKERTSETYLDVCTLQDKNFVHGQDLEVPWTVACERQKRVDVGDSQIYIPSPEALLIMKSKAAHDRNFDVVTGQGDDFKRDKVKKDRFDLISLIVTCEFDTAFLHELLKRFKFGQCFKEALNAALDDESVMVRFKFDKKKVAAIRKKAEILFVVKE